MLKSLFLLFLISICACADPVCGPSMRFVPTGDFYSCVPNAIATASLYGNVSGAASMPYALTAAQALTLLGSPWAPFANNTILGNISGGSAAPVGLTVAQTMTLLGAAPAASPSFTGHLAVTAGTAPTIAGCGTGAAALSATSTDSKGTITLGTTPGSCVLTFSATFTTVPDCTVSFTGGTSGAYSAAATALTVTATGLSGAVNYSCWK